MLKNQEVTQKRQKPAIKPQYVMLQHQDVKHKR
jgi:hypothetical protein